MADLYAIIENKKKYWDKRSCSSPEEWFEKLSNTRTVYVGNLTFTTPEERIHQVFKMIGQIDYVTMGLNSVTLTPCGFAFVTFRESKHAKQSVHALNGCYIDGRVIRVDLDPGTEVDVNRKLARGLDGNQWRDVFRNDFDIARGGTGLGISPDSLNSYARNIKRRRA